MEVWRRLWLRGKHGLWLLLGVLQWGGWLRGLVVRPLLRAMVGALGGLTRCRRSVGCGWCEEAVHGCRRLWLVGLTVTLGWAVLITG